jgi:hypothetical protein
MLFSSKLIHVTTPEILWHGGGLDHGKPDPVYSVDYHPKENILLTTGIDASVPPKGSIRVNYLFFADFTSLIMFLFVAVENQS